MNYLERLGELKKGRGVVPTEPTKAPSVASVGSTPPAFPETSSRQPDPARLLAGLAGAIERACSLRGDSAANRRALIREAADLSLEHQRDLMAHFKSEAQIWAVATGAERGYE